MQPALVAFIVFVHLLYSLHVPAYSAATNSISAGEALIGDDKLVSSNGRYALGFFHLGGKASRHTPKNWYLGIWYDKVSQSQLIPIWVANRESPVVGHHRMLKLAISDDGNLVIFNQAIGSMVWSTHASITTKATTAVLMENGNLVLSDVSNSNILWQSFDYLTDVMPPDSKIGLINKVTGLNNRLVSKKSLIDPAPGRYSVELDPTGTPQYLFKLRNTSIVYWSTGEWNGQYFSSVPEMSGHTMFDYRFINNDKEEYFQIKLLEDVISINLLDMTGQNKLMMWVEKEQYWETLYTQPKDLCDIYATCGPFTIDGCTRNTPLDCSITNHSGTATTDKFYPLHGVTLP